MATAKQTKTAPVNAPGTTDAPAAPKVPKIENDAFTRVYVDGKPAPLPPNTKLAPQAQVIVNAIEAAGKKGITRTDLVSALTGVIVTRQPITRIITYYQKTLQALGQVTRTVVPTEAAK